MAAFAEVDDLESRWRPLSDAEKDRAAVLLEDAAAILRAELAMAGKSDEGPHELLRLVNCSMVRRAMASSFEDCTQATVTAGSFSQQMSFANPSGNLYITADERRVLGIQKRRMRIGSIAPRIGGD